MKQTKLEKRSQVERVAIANALLASVWTEIMDGHTERGVLQEAVYAQTSVNRIVWKLNEINNKGQEEQP
jgi:hypothetical protein